MKKILKRCVVFDIATIFIAGFYNSTHTRFDVLGDVKHIGSANVSMPLNGSISKIERIDSVMEWGGKFVISYP